MWKSKDDVSVVWKRGVKLLRLVVKPGTTTDICVDPDVERNPPEVFVRLLGLILGQAHHDGMSEISFSAHKEPETLQMQYRGDSEDGVDTWWDMIPPPADCYACLVKAIVEVTSFGTGVEPTGVINAEINGKPVEVKVQFASWYDVTLSWPSAGADGKPR